MINGLSPHPLSGNKRGSPGSPIIAPIPLKQKTPSRNREEVRRFDVPLPAPPLKWGACARPLAAVVPPAVIRVAGRLSTHEAQRVRRSDRPVKRMSGLEQSAVRFERTTSENSPFTPHSSLMISSPFLLPLHSSLLQYRHAEKILVDEVRAGGVLDR